MKLKFTKQQSTDVNKIAQWLLTNVPTIAGVEQSRAWALIIVGTRGYDANKPMPNNRIGGFEFDMPAPATMG